VAYSGGRPVDSVFLAATAWPTTFLGDRMPLM
jgi:hypothetical protein